MSLSRPSLRLPVIGAARKAPAEATWHLSDGEVHFLYWFIQGSIMSPETRGRLRRAWGMCPRHSIGYLLVDAAFRRGWMHGPALLYADLMEHALVAVRSCGPLGPLLCWNRLRSRGPCLMCELHYGPHSMGHLNWEELQRGRNPDQLQTFACSTRPYWSAAVCGRCAGNGARPRCRPHLLAEGRAGPEQRQFVAYLTHHLSLYHRSFRWEYRATDTSEDRAALIGALGWCTGWRPWLALVDQLNG